MRILHVVDKLDAGGAERTLLTLANVFHQKSHKVDVLTFRRGGTFEKQLAPEINLINLDRKWKFNPLKFRKLSAIATDYDIIHIHMRHVLKYLYIANILFPFKSKIFFQDQFGDIDFNKKADFLLRLALKSTLYIAVRKLLANWAIDNIHLKPAHVFLLHNTVEKKQTIATKTNSINRLKLVLVSNFRRTKNIEFAINLIASMRKNGEVELTIFGQIVDEGYYNEIVKRIQIQKLDNFIKIVTDQYDIQDFLPSFDLAIHPSKSEAYPLVLVEYIAQGLPFLVVNAGELADILHQEISEFLLNDYDLNIWEKKIKAIVSLEDDRIKSKIDQVYKKYYSLDTYYLECMRIYKEGLNF